MRADRTALLVAIAVCALTLAGCDSARVAEVKGTASYAGAPIEDGSITFIPVDAGGTTEGGLIKDGQYTAKSAIGAMKVVITATKVVGKKKLYDAPNSPEQAIKGQFLPKKYADRDTTELTLTVTPGLNRKNWVLEK